MTRLAILISGRGSNMAAIVTQCQAGILSGVATPAVVVSNRRDAGGLTIAREAGIDAVCVPSAGRTRETFERDLVAVLRPYKPDLVILAGFMRILSPYFVGKYKGRILNIHPADTRRYKGAHGYEWALENKLEETSITVHLVSEQLDAGAIIAQEKVDLRGANNLDEVMARGLEVEHRIYARAIRKFITGGSSPAAL